MAERILFDESAAWAKVGHRIKAPVEFAGEFRGGPSARSQGPMRAARGMPWRFDGSFRNGARGRWWTGSSE